MDTRNMHEVTEAIYGQFKAVKEAVDHLEKAGVTTGNDYIALKAVLVMYEVAFERLIEDGKENEAEALAEANRQALAARGVDLSAATEEAPAGGDLSGGSESDTGSGDSSTGQGEGGAGTGDEPPQPPAGDPNPSTSPDPASQPVEGASTTVVVPNPAQAGAKANI